MFNIFNRLKYFTPNENWGDPSKINGLLLLLLDDIRDIWQEPFIIHCAYETSGHSPKSQHYIGNAVDFHIVSDMSFLDQVLQMEEIVKNLQVDDRIGLGFYPDWNHPGFHLDVRGTKARWCRIDGKYYGWDYGIEYLKNNK